MLDCDEVNCNFVPKVFFIMYSKVQILVICNNHESNVQMNCSGKFVET
jgi:hypothetical protein